MNASELTRMTGRLAPLVAATTLFLAPAVSSLSAQEPTPPPLGDPVDERACTCAWEFDSPRAMRSFAVMNRARIGVELGEPTEVGGRTGIRLGDVVEGGPAARAGLREGDILLALNGSDLGDQPTRRLLELLRDVDPGDAVTLAYSRDGREQTASVVTDEAHGVFGYRAGRAPSAMRLRQMEPLRRAMAAPAAGVFMRQMFGDGLELVAMNEGLGEYFNVSEGILVTAVDDDSTLGLQPGDVILSIGGREVREEGHARSILRSYRPEESIAFEVVRDRTRMTVTGTRARPGR